MASGTFDVPPVSPMSAQSDAHVRRSSGGSPSFQRNYVRRHSPSPTSSRRSTNSYDAYGSSPRVPPLSYDHASRNPPRQDWPSPDPYLDRPPSPDRYPAYREREATVDAWGRSIPWQPPPSDWDGRRYAYSHGPPGNFDAPHQRRHTVPGPRTFEPNEAWLDHADRDRYARHGIHPEPRLPEYDHSRHDAYPEPYYAPSASPNAYYRDYYPLPRPSESSRSYRPAYDDSAVRYGPRRGSPSYSPRQHHGISSLPREQSLAPRRTPPGAFGDNKIRDDASSGSSSTRALGDAAKPDVSSLAKERLSPGPNSSGDNRNGSVATADSGSAMNEASFLPSSSAASRSFLSEEPPRKKRKSISPAPLPRSSSDQDRGLAPAATLSKASIGKLLAAVKKPANPSAPAAVPGTKDTMAARHRKVTAPGSLPSFTKTKDTFRTSEAASGNSTPKTPASTVSSSLGVQNGWTTYPTPIESSTGLRPSPALPQEKLTSISHAIVRKPPAPTPPAPGPSSPITSKTSRLSDVTSSSLTSISSTASSHLRTKGNLKLVHAEEVADEELPSTAGSKAEAMDVDDLPLSISIKIPPGRPQNSTRVASELPQADGSLPAQSGTELKRARPIATAESFMDRESEALSQRKADARSIANNLRWSIQTRTTRDIQTCEAIVEPVLMQNLSLQDRDSPESLGENSTIWDDLAGQLTVVPATDKLRTPLIQRVCERHTFAAAKLQRLREEYQSLHNDWLAHCTRLDDAKAARLAHGTEAAPASGRHTRRSAAMLSDAVRSDLEMEQIIASLGYDDSTDPRHLALKNLAKVPDMISVSNGQVDMFFDDTNNSVEEPEAFFDIESGIDDWTEAEKEIFVEKFAQYPKQFGLIAKHLPYKTASQCVTFYYLHKKQFIDFRKVVLRFGPGKRRRGGRKADKPRGNGLLADIQKHDDEVSASRRSRRTADSRKPVSIRRARASGPITASPTPTSTPDPEPVVRQRKPRLSQSTRVEVMTREEEGESTDVEPKTVVKKKGKPGRKPKTPAYVIDDDEPPTPTPPMETSVFALDSNTRKKPVINPAVSQWSDEDTSVFLRLLSQYGDDFKRISASMPNKTTTQVSNWYKQNLEKWDLANVASQAPKRSPTPDLSADNADKIYPKSGTVSQVVNALAASPSTSSTTHFDRWHLM